MTQPPATLDPRVLASDALRHLAKDEHTKERIERDPFLRSLFERISRRYVGGVDLETCLSTVAKVNARGHLATVDYMGENTRDAAKANAETDEFVRLARELGARGLNSSISLDLSHIGLVIDPELCHQNASRIASAAKAIGAEMIVSMEWSERTDAILGAYERLCGDFDNVGITCQARLHRTAPDLNRLLTLPGKIRLVKGAYEESEEVASPPGSAALQESYRRFAQTLIASGHPCSIATHDLRLLDELHHFIETEGLRGNPYEFEMLIGLGPDQLDLMRERGHPTREYVVYGSEWFLYVCNRIAEQPERLFLAVADALGTDL